MIERLRSLFATGTSHERVSGEPKSANGASSLHLVWDMPPTPLIEVSAILEVLQPPAVPRLYFWALQVSFVSDRRLRGGGHIGLQWHRGHPGSTAANWGGYAAPDQGGAILSGSVSDLPSARNNPNTRDFVWKVGHRYRLRVAPSPESPPDVHAWRGSITDLESGRETVIRDLYTDGAALTAPMVWTEAFARCEQPSVAVRWSDLRAVDESGTEVRPTHVRANYQARADGGCDNTTAVADELGIVQVTATPRQVPQGGRIAIPSRGSRT